MNTVREIQRLNKQEAEQGITGDGSWHHQYRHSAWVYVGGLPYEMTEGDVLCFFSQVGEIEKLDMRREAETGKFRGFCFIKYEDQRSTILAVDNFTGVSFAGRVIKVDHKEYNPPTKKKKRKRGEEVDSSEEENEQRELEERKALTDVRWENTEYRDKANLEPKKKKRKLSKEERKAKKEKKKARKQEKLLKKQRKRSEREPVVDKDQDNIKERQPSRHTAETTKTSDDSRNERTTPRYKDQKGGQERSQDNDRQMRGDRDSDRLRRDRDYQRSDRSRYDRRDHDYERSDRRRHSERDERRNY